MVRRIARVVLGLLLVAAVPGVPTAYANYRQTAWRNFHVVVDGVLYRSGQLSPPVLDRIVHDHGIATVVCLRSLSREGDTVLENREELECAERGLRYVRLNPKAWRPPEGGTAVAPAQENVDAFLAEVRAGRGPVLVHCFAGLHRTGLFCAIYRMEIDGWTNAEAVAEMKSLGYAQIDADAIAYLVAYRPGGMVPHHAELRQ